VLAIEARDAAVRLQLDPAFLDWNPVMLDEAPEQRQRKRGLLEARRAHDAGHVEPAEIGSVACSDVDADTVRSRLGPVDLPHQLPEPALVASRRDSCGPTAPGR